MARLIWNEMTRDELTAVLPGAVVVFPTAATEQHGPHLVTGHDSFTVAAIAEEAALSAQATVVQAPTLMFGSSHHHLQFGERSRSPPIPTTGWCAIWCSR